MRGKTVKQTSKKTEAACVTNMGTKLFNKLPIQIKQLDDYKGFKREVKNFLLHNSFYTIEEFFHFEGF